MVASAAIHGLLFALWLNISGNIPDSPGQKETVLELVTIENLTTPSQITTTAEVKTVKKEPIVTQPEQQQFAQAKAEAAPHSVPAVSYRPVTKTDTSENPTSTQVARLTTITPAPAGQIAAATEKQHRSDAEQTTSMVRNHLESFKFYPASARRRGIEGHVDVAFTLSQNGTADQVTVLQGSGYAMLDRAAMQTVYRAQPFPADNGKYRFRLRFKRL